MIPKINPYNEKVTEVKELMKITNAEIENQLMEYMHGYGECFIRSQQVKYFEAFEKGLITLDDTVVPLKFGNKDSYINAIKFIASGRNEFYKILGRGVRAASEKYGGKDFAMQVAGLEMAGYHTGYGSLVGAAIGARHSHLCNGGYSIDQGLKTFDPAVMLDKLEHEEKERCMLNCLVLCLFARRVYDRPTILSALNTLDWNLTDGGLTEIALRVYKTKLRIKKALGFDLNNIRLPKRFFETPSMRGTLDEATAYEILEKYRERLSELTGSTEITEETV